MKQNNRLLVVIITLFVHLIGCKNERGLVIPPQNHGQVGSLMPDIELLDSNGNNFNYSNLTGLYSLIVFLNINQSESRAQLVSLELLRHKIPDWKVSIIGIHVHTNAQDQLNRLLISRPVDFQLLTAHPGVELVYSGKATFPVLFFSDKKRIILKRFEGYRSPEFLEKMIRDATEQSVPDQGEAK